MFEGHITLKKGHIKPPGLSWIEPTGWAGPRRHQDGTNQFVNTIRRRRALLKNRGNPEGWLAPRAGLEPATSRLTYPCVELKPLKRRELTPGRVLGGHRELWRYSDGGPTAPKRHLTLTGKTLPCPVPLLNPHVDRPARESGVPTTQVVVGDVWFFSELNCVIRTSASGRPRLAVPQPDVAYSSENG